MTVPVHLMGSDRSNRLSPLLITFTLRQTTLLGCVDGAVESMCFTLVDGLIYLDFEYFSCHYLDWRDISIAARRWSWICSLPYVYSSTCWGSLIRYR